MLSVPHVNQVHIFYRARLIDLDFGPGTESLDVQLFPEADIPWQGAFRTVSTLRHYYTDRTAGAFAFHSGEILPVPRSEGNAARGLTAAAGAAFCAFASGG